MSPFESTPGESTVQPLPSSCFLGSSHTIPDACCSSSFLVVLQDPPPSDRPRRVGKGPGTSTWMPPATLRKPEHPARTPQGHLAVVEVEVPAPVATPDVWMSRSSSSKWPASLQQIPSLNPEEGIRRRPRRKGKIPSAAAAAASTGTATRSKTLTVPPDAATEEAGEGHPSPSSSNALGSRR